MRQVEQDFAPTLGAPQRFAIVIVRALAYLGLLRLTTDQAPNAGSAADPSDDAHGSRANRCARVRQNARGCSWLAWRNRGT
jgi:hypothetical protein